MNKDEIKKALRCCSKGQGCCDCPHWCEAGCRYQTLSDALELITEQEQEIERQNSRIKALNNRLNEKYELISDMERKIYDLKDDFESLQKDYEFVRDCDAEHCLEIEETVKQAKIDVLNELKTRHDYAIKNMGYPWDILRQIDELIKEVQNEN